MTCLRDQVGVFNHINDTLGFPSSEKKNRLAVGNIKCYFFFLNIKATRGVSELPETTVRLIMYDSIGLM